MQESLAVSIALRHIESWCRGDWQTTQELLSPAVHAQVTTTDPGFGDRELQGIESYMAAKTKGARLIEPGSLQVLSTIGDARSAFIAVTFKIALGPAGATATMARSCLYLIDEGGKIKEERDAFFIVAR